MTIGRDLKRATAIAMTLGIVIAMVFTSCGSSDDTADELDNPDETGAELIETYAVLIREKDLDGLDDFISDAFIIQRADGSYRLKDGYLNNIPDLEEWTVSEVKAVQDGDVLTVHWLISVHSVVDGVRTSTDPAPRLSTFIYDDGEWRLSSHANFNAPATDEE